MDAETDKVLTRIADKLDLLEHQVNKRIDSLKNIIMSYLEYGSSIGLSSVKANLKNV